MSVLWLAVAILQTLVEGGVYVYNPSTHYSQSAEIQEVRTTISQISATLALLVKALSPDMLEAGTQVQLQQIRAPQSGVRVEESFGSAKERFALETPPRR